MFSINIYNICFFDFTHLIGVIPYSFSATSHLAVTFGLSVLSFVGVDIVGLQIH